MAGQTSRPPVCLESNFMASASVEEEALEVLRLVVRKRGPSGCTGSYRARRCVARCSILTTPK